MRLFVFVGSLFLMACAADVVDGFQSSDEALTTSRPIAELVDAQGRFCFPDGLGGCLLSAPPWPNFLAFRQEDPELCMMVDYAGVADRYLREVSGGAVSLGTTMDGSISERTLDDGRVLLSVRLQTERALTWVS